jgi:integrase
MGKTHREWVDEALAHEGAARWSEASRAWAEARRAAKADTPTSPPDLAPGAIVQHVSRGEVLAECTYAGPGDWRYHGASYASPTAAANAAAAYMGKKTGRQSGWIFWGIRKRWEGARREWQQENTPTNGANMEIDTTQRRKARGGVTARKGLDGRVRYYGRVVDLDGVRKHRLLKADTMAAAKDELAEMRARVRKGLPAWEEEEAPKPATKADALTVRDLAERFCGKVPDDADAETRKAAAAAACQADSKDPEKYLRAMWSAFDCHLIPYLGDKPAADVRRTDVARWRESMKADGRTNRQIVRGMVTASKLWNWALELGHLPDDAQNPISAVSKPGLNKSTEHYTDDEVARLLSTAAKEKPDLHPVIAAAYFTGARRGELAALRWGDVDFDAGKIYIRRSWASDSRKSGVAVTVGLHPHLRAILEALAAPDRAPEALVFPDPVTGEMRPEFDHEDRVWGLRRVAKEAKVRRLKMPWHALRHSHGTALAAAGANLGEIQAALGQSSLEMAKRYTEISADAVAKRVAALPALGPVTPSKVATLHRPKQDKNRTKGATPKTAESKI